jgi:hypothetical protein
MLVTNAVNFATFNNSRFTSPSGNSQSQDLDQDNRRTTSSQTDQESQQDRIAEQREIQQLKNLDREVRAHELAHVSVGGRYVTSGANFQYERGPDGRLYAVAGEVSINTSPIPGNPQASLQKAQTVLRAAMAPTNPSAQDRRVATQALSMIQQARVELALEDGSASTAGNQVDTFA